MAIINNLTDFNNITSNITSFSHAYLFSVSSLSTAYPYVKEFAKKIICNKKYQAECQEECDVCYQIDNEEYDDYYVVNPDTIGINTEEITKLLAYMKTKSIHDNGKRVYVIYGFERLSRDVSNKILKFLEEPEENVYALLITENIDKILPTIISRCQIISLSFPEKDDEDIILTMKKFLKNIYEKHNSAIAYINDYWGDLLVNRLLVYESFTVIEKIITNCINKYYNLNFNDNYVCDFLDNLTISQLINILEITNHLKSLIKQNINLNLLIDRYIIGVTRELIVCQK